MEMWPVETLQFKAIRVVYVYFFYIYIYAGLPGGLRFFCVGGGNRVHGGGSTLLKIIIYI